MMSQLRRIYSESLSLLTDLYQLTMAYAYWRAGLADREAVFHLHFRRSPFGGSFAVAAGLETALDYLEDLRFSRSDLEYLGEIPGADGNPLFPPAFLQFLAGTSLRCDIDAMAEGTAAFPHEPLLRVRGPLYQCQLVETPLLAIVNFQTLIATKAARVNLAAGGDPVLEFGLRRAHGIDGGLSASRAAHIGGCAATSNVLAGKLFGIPVKGTHAHSWVMAFADERDAFRKYADALPNNCTFLVDTYDTHQGVRHAIEVGEELRSRGHELLGIRLDSGDLAKLSVDARATLDEAGFHGTRIVASSDLDERLIHSLKQQGARIDIWGVGTRLVTAYDQPALGGVYKLSALRDPQGAWSYKIKLSEQEIKVSTPGVLQVRRFTEEGRLACDVVFDEELGPGKAATLMDTTVARRDLAVPDMLPHTDLLVPVVREGRRLHPSPPLAECRQRTLETLRNLPRGCTRFLNPARYPVALEQRLQAIKLELIQTACEREEKLK